MAKDSIPLHPKYGVNPTIPLCFYCGKEKGEIALLGNNYKGEAPKNMVIDIIPCDECKAKYEEEYTLLVEADSGKKTKGVLVQLVPTGRWCAVKHHLLNIDPPKKFAYVDSELMDLLLKIERREKSENG